MPLYAPPATLTPWSCNGFLLEDNLPQGMKSFGRGVLKNVQGIEKKQIISSVVAHRRGEVRTASRFVAKRVTFTGHVFAPWTQDEPDLINSLDLLKAALTSGSGPIPFSVWPDGRYMLGELEQFEDGVNEGEPTHAEYTATMYCPDPYAYGTLTTQTLLAAQPLTQVGSSTLYVYRYGGEGAVTLGMGLGRGWPAPAWPGLGSAPSDLQITVTLNTANGCFKLAALNPQTTPAQSAVAIAAPFSDGDSVTFDGPAQTVTYIHNGVSSSTTAPAGVLTLQSGSANVGGLTIAARASGGAPVITVTAQWQARYV